MRGSRSGGRCGRHRIPFGGGWLQWEACGHAGEGCAAGQQRENERLQVVRRRRRGRSLRRGGSKGPGTQATHAALSPPHWRPTQSTRAKHSALRLPLFPCHVFCARRPPARLRRNGGMAAARARGDAGRSRRGQGVAIFCPAVQAAPRRGLRLSARTPLVLTRRPLRVPQRRVFLPRCRPAIRHAAVTLPIQEIARRPPQSRFPRFVGSCHHAGNHESLHQSPSSESKIAVNTDSPPISISPVCPLLHTMRPLPFPACP